MLLIGDPTEAFFQIHPFESELLSKIAQPKSKMIVSDTHNFASRISRDMSSIQEERLEYTEKLSSGKKHVCPFDDAGALSMEMKNESELKRMRQVSQTLQNGLSYTHAQQAALQIVQGIYRRMSTLATMAPGRYQNRFRPGACTTVNFRNCENRFWRSIWNSSMGRTCSETHVMRL